MLSYIIHCDDCHREERCPYNFDPYNFANRRGWWVNGLVFYCHDCAVKRAAREKTN